MENPLITLKAQIQILSDYKTSSILHPIEKNDVLTLETSLVNPRKYNGSRLKVVMIQITNTRTGLVDEISTIKLNNILKKIKYKLVD